MKIGYILPDGSFFNLIENGYKTHAHYEKSIIRKITNLKGWIRVNDGSNVKYENIIELPIKPISEEQYLSLVKFLDYMYYSKKDFVDIGIEENSIGTRFTNNAIWFKHYDFSEYIVDDIIKEIKQIYNKLSIIH